VLSLPAVSTHRRLAEEILKINGSAESIQYWRMKVHMAVNIFIAEAAPL
jgi:hypothetical protein